MWYKPGFSSLQCIHAHVPPVRGHTCETTPCPASSGTCSPSPPWLTDSSSVLSHTAKTRFLICINDVCTNHVSQVINKTSQHGFMGCGPVPLCHQVYELCQYDLLGHIHLISSLLLKKAKQSPSSVLRMQFPLIWWLLHFHKMIPLRWAEMLWVAVRVGKSQPGRTFPLQLLGLL